MVELFPENTFANLPSLARCALAARAIRHCQLVIDRNSDQYAALDRIAELAERFGCGLDVGTRELQEARQVLRDEPEGYDWDATDFACSAAGWTIACIKMFDAEGPYPIRHAINASIRALPAAQNMIARDLELVRQACDRGATDDRTPFPPSVFEPPGGA